MKNLLFAILPLFLLMSCSSSEVPVSTDSTQSWKIIVALGDSLTAGYGLPVSVSYPSQLERRLTGKSYNYRIVNAWISGDTSAWLLSRLDWVLDGQPSSLIILCIGANDAFQWKDTSEIEQNIRNIIEKIQSKKIPILFAGMRAPLNLWGEYGKKYEAIFPKLAKEYDLVFMPFLLQGVSLKAELNQDDRIHPTASGYTIVVDNLLEILEDEKLIKK